jgi:hypothetical protein
MIKSKTKVEKQWLSDVASLGCIVCRNLEYGETPAEIHHIRVGTGMAQRASHFDVIPLCPRHHRLGSEAYHSAPANWEARFGQQTDLVQQTHNDVQNFRSMIVGGR